MKDCAVWHLKRITQSGKSHPRPVDLVRQCSSISLTGACGRPELGDEGQWCDFLVEQKEVGTVRLIT